MAQRPRPRPYDYLRDRTQESQDLLHLQDFHRSRSVWEKEARNQAGQVVDASLNETLRVRRYKFIPHRVQNERFVQLMFQSGFYRCWQMGYLSHVDSVVVTALVERWRPETHTFHMAYGEMTVTLQDVNVLLQLPTKGLAITGLQVPHNWGDLCVELLGIDPTTYGGNRKNKIKLNWLASNFDATTLTENTPDEVVEQYVRANILLLIGSQLFPDKDAAAVKVCWLPFLRELNSIRLYSWGGAILAFLYKQLCIATNEKSKEIAGATHLLCMWAWQRFPRTCPIFHMNGEQVLVPQFWTVRWNSELKMKRSILTLSEMRRILEELDSADIIWRPYDVDALISVLTQEDKDHWRARVPLICFADVEWHYPDRVLRQLGFAQDIPRPPEPEDGIHGSDFRGPSDRDWEQLYKGHVLAWTEWRMHVVNGAPGHYDIHYHDAYMDWYRKVTIRFMTIRGAAQPILSDAVERIWYSTQGEQLHSDELRRIAESSLGAAGEQRRYRDLSTSQQVHSAEFNSEYVIPQEEKEPRGRRRRTLKTGRTRVESLEHVPCVPVISPMQWNDYMAFHNPNMAGSSSQSQFESQDMGRPMPHQNVYRPAMSGSPLVPSFQDFGGHSQSFATSFGDWQEVLNYPSSHQREMAQNVTTGSRGHQEQIGGDQSAEADDTDEGGDNGNGETEDDGTQTPLLRRGSRERNAPEPYTTSGEHMNWKQKNRNRRH